MKLKDFKLKKTLDNTRPIQAILVAIVETDTDAIGTNGEKYPTTKYTLYFDAIIKGGLTTQHKVITKTLNEGNIAAFLNGYGELASQKGYVIDDTRDMLGVGFKMEEKITSDLRAIRDFKDVLPFKERYNEIASEYIPHIRSLEYVEDSATFFLKSGTFSKNEILNKINDTKDEI